MTVLEPLRRVFETGTSSDGVVYIVEPVAVDPTGGTGGGVRAYEHVGPITTTAGPCGMDGVWTATPTAWQAVIPAEVGHLVEWSPAIVLGGGPAALDLAAIVAGAPARYASSGTATPNPKGHGGLFSQGDPGTTRLPVLKWRVQAGDLEAGNLTLALCYRAATTGDTLTLGDVEAPSTIDVTNLGHVGGGTGTGGGTGDASAPITWDDVNNGTPGAPPPTDPIGGTVVPERLPGVSTFTGAGSPLTQPQDSPVFASSVEGDLYVDVTRRVMYRRNATTWEYLCAIWETMIWLGTGEPGADFQDNYHLAHNIAIDMETSFVYELDENGGIR